MIEKAYPLLNIVEKYLIAETAVLFLVICDKLWIKRSQFNNSIICLNTQRADSVKDPLDSTFLTL